MYLHPLVQMTLVKIRELRREPEAIFWIFVFPLLLALALGIAFRSSAPEEIPVGIQQGSHADSLLESLEDAEGLRAEILSRDEARERLRSGKLALVVEGGTPWVYHFDPTRPDSRLARLSVDAALQAAAGRQDVHPVRTEELTEKGSRYIDFLIPGLLGMNLMGTGMWGIGFYIVNARSKRLLKRFVATPMRKSHYLLSAISGRLIFLFFEVAVLVAFARLAFDVPLRGSVWTLGLVSVVGALSFGGLGLLVASRAKTLEGVSGLMNFVMMPMWICSGTFFSTGRFPDSVQPLIQGMPLTAINDALRSVMLDGASLVAVGGEVAIAAAWGVGTFALALSIFRWQ